MLFSSQAFILLFLPIALIAYYAATSKAWRLRVLIVSSVVFYSYWDIRFVPLLVFSILANWLVAQWFHKHGRVLGLRAGIVLNLSILAVFKYADFFATNLSVLFDLEHQPWSLVLPLGISFFTFQQISYLADVNKGKAPAYTWEEYTAYVMFFPQLIAGPIVRHNELIPQFDHQPDRSGLHERLSRGLTLFTLGLIKKVFLADELGPLVDARFEPGLVLSGPEAWFAAVAYSLQLYFDFSAYSDMAIGLALLFGFSLPINFDRPYRALSIRDFWRRWHISLSRFLRDYVYIPLGGSRQGALGVACAAMATMLLCGLWHGAGWTFVVWGGLHGAAVLVNRSWAKLGWALPTTLAWLLTWLFVVFGWVLFRAGDFTLATEIIYAMLGSNGWGGLTPKAEDLRFIGLGFGLAVFGPTNVVLCNQRLQPRRWLAVGVGIALLVVVLRVGVGRGLEFIYFQF